MLDTEVHGGTAAPQTSATVEAAEREMREREAGWIRNVRRAGGWDSVGEGGEEDFAANPLPMHLKENRIVPLLKAWDPSP